MKSAGLKNSLRVPKTAAAPNTLPPAQTILPPAQTTPPPAQATLPPAQNTLRPTATHSPAFTDPTLRAAQATLPPVQATTPPARQDATLPPIKATTLSAPRNVTAATRRSAPTTAPATRTTKGFLCTQLDFFWFFECLVVVPVQTFNFYIEVNPTNKLNFVLFKKRTKNTERKKDNT
jgi:hypothetical protein